MTIEPRCIMLYFQLTPISCNHVVCRAGCRRREDIKTRPAERSSATRMLLHGNNNNNNNNVHMSIPPWVVTGGELVD